MGEKEKGIEPLKMAFTCFVLYLILFFYNKRGWGGVAGTLFLLPYLFRPLTYLLFAFESFLPLELAPMDSSTPFYYHCQIQGEDLFEKNG